jgi:hypothetical protein
MYSKVNKKQTSIYNTKKNYTEKQTRTVNGLKRKIHKNAAEFYLPKIVLAKKSKHKFRSQKNTSGPLL